MNNQETDKIMSYLLAAYPENKLEDASFTIWRDLLKTFPYEVTQEACKAYIFQGGKFFPAIGEFVKLCDEIWQQHEQKQREANAQATKDAAKMLFYEPVHRLSYGEMAKQAVQLIRDVTGGQIKHNSPEWQDRYNKIFEGIKPRDTGCICEDGLVFYKKNSYSYVGSCSWCGKGNKNYPVINPQTLQREEYAGAGR